MKRTIRILSLTALILLVIGVALVGFAVAKDGVQQVGQWLGIPVSISHSEQGWQIDTPAYYTEPEMRVWEGDADDVTRLRLNVVDNDLELRAVEGADTVKLTWYERREGEYGVKLEEGALELSTGEFVGLINFDLADMEAMIKTPAFILEYPAEKEWLAVVLTGVDGEIRGEEHLVSEQVSVDMTDGLYAMTVNAGRFSMDATDTDITVELDCENVVLDLVDTHVKMTLAGEETDYRFDVDVTDGELTLNGKDYPEDGNVYIPWSEEDAARQVQLKGTDVEADIVTGHK